MGHADGLNSECGMGLEDDQLDFRRSAKIWLSLITMATYSHQC